MKLTAIFVASLMKKTYQWIDLLVNLLADKKAVDSTKNILCLLEIKTRLFFLLAYDITE